MLDMAGQPIDQNPLEELPGGYYVHSSQPPDSVLGFSTWPPESWETLFNDPSIPPYTDNTNLGLDMPFNSLTPRMQESAERGQLSLASAALVVKLSNSFPVSPFSFQRISCLGIRQCAMDHGSLTRV